MKHGLTSLLFVYSEYSMELESAARFYGYINHVSHAMNCKYVLKLCIENAHDF